PQFVSNLLYGVELDLYQEVFGLLSIRRLRDGLTRSSYRRSTLLDNLSLDFNLTQRVDFDLCLLPYLHIRNVGFVYFDLRIDLRHIGDRHQRSSREARESILTDSHG